MEGPSLVILLEEIKLFQGKKILEVSGNSKTIEVADLKGRTIKSFQSWGKHFLICFKGFYLRIHFLMFGSYTIDKPKDRIPRLKLKFTNGVLYLYTCSVRRFEGNPKDDYDWSSDLMSDEWSESKAVRKIKLEKASMVCDVLLDQDIFSGSGNIIKNEVLFRLFLHPERLINSLSQMELKSLASETRNYCFDFYNWKKVFMLNKNWQVYKKKICPLCKKSIIKKSTGLLKRRSFFCSNCQK